MKSLHKTIILIVLIVGSTFSQEPALQGDIFGITEKLWFKETYEPIAKFADSTSPTGYSFNYAPGGVYDTIITHPRETFPIHVISFQAWLKVSQEQIDSNPRNEYYLYHIGNKSLACAIVDSGYRLKMGVATVRYRTSDRLPFTLFDNEWHYISIQRVVGDSIYFPEYDFWLSCDTVKYYVDGELLSVKKDTSGFSGNYNTDAPVAICGYAYSPITMDSLNTKRIPSTFPGTIAEMEYSSANRSEQYIKDHWDNYKTYGVYMDTETGHSTTHSSKSVTVFPNPANPSTTFNFSLSEPQKVSIKILDICGKIVSEVTDQYFSNGNHSVKWLSSVSTGIYIYQCKIGNRYTSTNTITIVK